MSHYVQILPRFRSRWAMVMQLFAVICMTLQPVSLSFGDWVTGGANGYADYSWDDTDANGSWDNGEEGYFFNSDTDLLPDHAERTLGTDIYNPDSDYDGLNDYDEAVALVPSGFSFSPLSWDTNGDGISDSDALYGCYTVNYTQNPPSLSGWTYSDWDGDGVKNHADAYPFDPNNGAFLDGDGDGCYDSFDTDPTNPALWEDHNRNGINDSAEPPVTDADGDGHVDGADSHPSNASLWSDWNSNGINDDAQTDGDGVPDELDSHPSNASLWSDWNNNGTNDDADGDADSVPDEIDSHPSNASLWSDWNNNGINDDAHSDADGVPDESDSHPSNASLWCDWNNNGTNDTAEVDADNDTVWDSLDSHPTNSALWCDWNGTGINDDQNSDGDSAADDYDSDPSNNALWSDWNRNGVNDDQHSDADGVADDYDSDPLVSSLWADWNRNGTNDFDEPPPPQDSDGDNVFDANDSDPYNWWLWEDWNRNGVNDSQEWTPPDDSDGDGIPDYLDEYPNDPFNGDSDQDGALDVIEAQHGAVVGMIDTDEDGLTDGQEINSAGTDPADVDSDDDGLTDCEECMITDLVQLGVNPLNAHSLSVELTDWEMAQPRLIDADQDGIPSYIETLYGLEPSDPNDAAGDLDGDGVSNLDQYEQGRSLLTGVGQLDQDDDGMSDAWEDANGFNKIWFDDALGDPDGDQVRNFEEYLSGAYYLSWATGSGDWVQSGQMDPHDATTFEGPEWVQFRPEDYVDSWWGYRVMNDWERFYNLTRDPYRFYGIKHMRVPDQMPLMYPYYMYQNSSDVDGDRMPDLWEYRYHLDPRVCMDGPWDMDGDGLTNLLEYQLRTDPSLQISKNDGILDGNRDYDGDGMSNAWEILWLDPANWNDPNDDFDGDGLNNLYEYLCGLNPWDADCDNDGILDGEEDTDGDSLTNGKESALGTNPVSTADMDADSLPRDWEFAMGLSDADKYDALMDADGDRVPNLFEFNLGTDAADPASFTAPHYTVDANAAQTSTVRNTIGSAINLSSGYKIIRIVPGDYVEKNAITSGRHLLFLGDTTGRSSWVSEDGQITNLFGTNCVFRDLDFNSSGWRQETAAFFIQLASVNEQTAFVNCTIRNHGLPSTAPMFVDRGTVVVQHCTFTGNVSGPGGGGSIYLDTGTKLVLRNSILWNPASHGSNEIFVGSTSTVVANDNIIRGGGFGGININPMLDRHGYLLSGSPAIRAGSTASVSLHDGHGDVRDSLPDYGVDEYQDSDSDTLPDWWERRYFGDVTTATGGGDDDLPGPDGLSNHQEYLMGFDPLNRFTLGGTTETDLVAALRREWDAYFPSSLSADADGDGLNAGWESYYGSSDSNPDSNGDGIPDGVAAWSGLNPATGDLDGDTLNGPAELVISTNPLMIDTDGDGVNDNVDAYPIDPFLTTLAATSGDVTAPLIALEKPAEAVLVP